MINYYNANKATYIIMFLFAHLTLPVMYEGELCNKLYGGGCWVPRKSFNLTSKDS